ncbi:MAG: Wzz/FepE/Etk N-terminal domain-containing protein [Rhodospirillales bacterium]|jgi:polysaccharide chain length determinant protein (PEP-CTERM system associated)|nr:Wzz/FepE/Etk N-terminal domain-containing protein [Rhodospirillales bacterium]
MDEDEKSLLDHWSMIRRRKWLIIVPFLVLFAISAGLALLLPPVYRSTATILIEEPDVPRELVTSTITGFADQRVQVIKQRVMATQNLLEIIRKYDLYADDRQRQPISQVVEDMREDIGMQLISAEVRDPRSGQAGEATIAFKLWFEHRHAQTAQRVANEIVALYISENVRERQSKVAQTSQFLSGEVRRLEATIAELEKRLTELKVAHAGSLPEQRNYNLQSIDRGEQELRDLERRAQTLQERMIYIRSMLIQISPHTAVAAGGPPILSPADQLRLFRNQLATVSKRYSPDHPDIVKLRREIESLEEEVKKGGGGSPRQRQADATDDFPPDNPAYIQLQSELQAAQTELQAVAAQADAVRARIVTFAKLIEQTPMVEREYQQLTRALDAANFEYREIRAKQTAADLGKSLETEHKGERFAIVEPPILPNEPTRPNRPAILLIGFVLSAAAGVGLAFLREMADAGVYSLRQAVAVTGGTPLAVIPYIRTRREVVQAWQLRTAIGVGSLLLIVGAATAVHVYVRPLDVLWATVENRIETSGFRLGI